MTSSRIIMYACALFACFMLGTFFGGSKEESKDSKPGQTLEFSRSVSATSNMVASAFNATPMFSASKILSEKIELTQEDKVAIGDLFAKIIERVSKEKFCSGGSYEVRPTYRYADGLRKVAGQDLESRLNCKITRDQIEAYGTLLNDLNHFVSESNLVTLNIPALEATFSTEEIKDNEDKLYKNILLKAQNYAKEYSKDLKLICNVATLRFDGAIPMPRYMKMSAYASPVQSDAVENATVAAKSNVPVVMDKEFTSNASVSFICVKK